MSAILPHMMWPLCEFRMHVWNVRHAVPWKYRMQTVAKNFPSTHHRTTSRAISPQLRHILTIGKIAKQQYLFSTCPHNVVNFHSLTAEIDWRVSGTPANFNGLPYCSDVAQRRSTTLCTMFGRLLGCYTIYTLTLRPSLAFSDIGSVTGRHSSSGRQPNFAAFGRGRHLYSAGGHHVVHRLTFYTFLFVCRLACLKYISKLHEIFVTSLVPVGLTIARSWSDNNAILYVLLFF